MLGSWIFALPRPSTPSVKVIELSPPRQFVAAEAARPFRVLLQASSSSLMRLLYLCDADGGGMAEYAIRQFHVLSNQGVEVTFLCRPTFEIQRLQREIVLPELPKAPARHAAALVRLFRQIRDSRTVMRIAADTALKGDYDGLLFACYREYFSPFWALFLRRAASKGLIIGTVAHDPVRDFALGPAWWHRWSVRMGYSFVRHVFVHDTTPVDFGGIRPQHLSVHVIPHGPYEVPAPTQERAALRDHYGFEDEDTVFLSFGQIRDGKNLDRFLRVMPELPEAVKLFVAGSGEAASQRPPEYYVRLAGELGIAHRCVWDLRYIPDAEAGNVFEMADHILLTYSGKFHSASGVLNAAAACRRSVLASSGPGPLKSSVEDYHLGVYVPPDDDGQILEGARRLISRAIHPEWKRYEQENSWERNARGVIEVFSGAS
jgi:glycosyltransferase involved in cell wall biosynthesis